MRRRVPCVKKNSGSFTFYIFRFEKKKLFAPSSSSEVLFTLRLRRAQHKGRAFIMLFSCALFIGELFFVRINGSSLKFG